MKRVGYLMPKICHFDNLLEAFLRSAKGKNGKAEVIRFRDRLHENLSEMAVMLADGSYPFGSYRFFRIHDPKPRLICAARFPDRVAFHAMMRICHPVFDKYQIDDSYASRIGKGTYKALDRTLSFSRRYQWYVKLDVRKYFDSISHQVMYAMLERLFKDTILMNHFSCILDSYQSSFGKGLPIGNLTSQYFANHYLAFADHYAKEQLALKGYVRYMDDMLLFGNDKEELLRKANLFEELITGWLQLELHDRECNECNRGIPFLGYVVRPSGLHLRQTSRHRYSMKLRQLTDLWFEGKMTDEKYRERLQSLTSFTEQADSYRLRLKMNGALGLFP